jgi:hypothetical protein
MAARMRRPSKHICYSERCVPSHTGALAVCLQPQKYTLPASDALYSIGKKLVPLWEPSQKGCFCDFPQLHHQYDLPASTSTATGVLLAITGLSIRSTPKDTWVATTSDHARVSKKPGTRLIVSQRPQSLRTKHAEGVEFR